MTCKPDSHPTLYEEVDLLATEWGGRDQSKIASGLDKVMTGRTYRYVEQVPLSR